jgi:alcohol dehydrogenase class IV
MKQEFIEDISSIDLKDLISKHECRRVFLVTVKEGAYVNSGAKEYIELALEGLEYVRFHDFEQNPKYEDAIKGVELFEQAKCDLIIAIGGGSVIDMAKLINVFSANSFLNSLDIIQNPKLIQNKGKTMIAIPTTSGTGSEATHFAVVYHQKKKYSVAHESILPDIAGLNYQFTITKPQYLTATTGLDAFSQAIESYWSVGSTSESKEYSKEAIQLLVKYLAKAVNSADVESRKAVMKGAFLAGKAINISKTTAAHAVSYAFTTYYSIPHGHAVFLTLPEFFEYNQGVDENDMNDSRGVDYTRDNIHELCKLLGVSCALEGKIFLREYAKKIGIELSLEKLGISDYKEKIIGNVNMERLGNNPRKITKEGLVALLKSKQN